jgi:1-acyl-sn-glycerol-3-phosphate acyltransferase
VSRDGSAAGAQESVAAARRVLEKGIHITTFVEGTRSPDGRLLPFKKGPFYLAMQTGAPCIPVSIFGTETMMAKGSQRISPGTAHVVFHPPIYPNNFATREELMASCARSHRLRTAGMDAELTASVNGFSRCDIVSISCVVEKTGRCSNCLFRAANF